MELARSFLTEAGVESDDLDNFNGSDIEFLSNPVDGLWANEAEAVLNFMQERKDGGTSLIGRILRDALIGLLLKLRRDRKGRKVDRAGCFRRGNILVEDTRF